MTVDENIDITAAHDGGVLKKIIKQGEGESYPCAGCEVIVHYTGTLLDGSKFDSSKDRDEPFKFQLGKGQVIKAWDLGISTMKKGEVCILTCAPEYAYGVKGCPPKIPPNSTLQFEVEMIDWEMEDLSPHKNKGILRQIITAGSSDANLSEGDMVQIEIEGKLADGKVFDKREVSFDLGEGIEKNICEGVEKALEKFQKEEVSKLIIQPKYGFKSEGNAELDVPPNAVLEYTVKLINFAEAKKSWLMDPSELLEKGTMYKERGTNYFKSNKFQMAIKMYKKAVSFAEDIPENASANDEEKSKSKELLLSIHLNLSLVYLKLTPPHYLEAKDHASKALAYDANNVKGLFRRGQALLGFGEAEQALNDFQKVLMAEPDNKAAANQIIVCRHAIQKQKEKEKKLYGNMFEKFAKHDTEVTDGENKS